uniref:Uncharacterized protein n=1 Tax=Anguilla anguilla TaxID=7936 RepID=A0A0E9QS14_ANGAN
MLLVFTLMQIQWGEAPQNHPCYVQVKHPFNTSISNAN